MNRADKRNLKRELNKTAKTISKLTPAQIKIIDSVSAEKARRLTEEYIDKIGAIVDFSTWASMSEFGIVPEEIEKIFNRSKELVKEESELYQKGEIDMEKKLTRSMIVESARKHGLDGKGKKKIAKELGSTYSTIMTYVSRWKITEEDLKPKVPISDAVEEKKIESKLEKKEDPEVEDAAEKIMKIIEGEDTVQNQDVSKEDEERAEKIIEEAKKMQCKEDVANSKEVKMEGLKVLEEKVVKTIKVRGENGVYEAETEKGVILSRENASIRFQNEEQLNEWVSEFKEVFKMVK